MGGPCYCDGKTLCVGYIQRNASRANARLFETGEVKLIVDSVPMGTEFFMSYGPGYVVFPADLSPEAAAQRVEQQREHTARMARRQQEGEHTQAQRWYDERAGPYRDRQASAQARGAAREQQQHRAYTERVRANAERTGYASPDDVMGDASGAACARCIRPAAYGNTRCEMHMADAADRVRRAERQLE